MLNIPKSAFVDTVSRIASGMPTSHAVAVLNGIKLSASDEDQTVTFAATDYDTTSRITIEAEVDGDADVLVSGRLLAVVAKSLPKRPTSVTVVIGDTTATVRSGAAEFTLPLMRIEDYPDLPGIHGVAVATIAADQLRALLAAGAAIADNKPERSGVVIDSVLTLREVNGLLTVAATDRFTLLCTSTETAVPEGFQVVLPSGPVKAQISPMLPAGDVELHSDGTVVGLVTADSSITTRTVDVEIPDQRGFDNLLATGNAATSVTADRAELLGILGRIGPHGKNDVVDLSFTVSDLTVRSVDGESTAFDQMPLTAKDPLTAGEFEMRINASKLTTLLRQYSDPEVDLFGIDLARGGTRLTATDTSHRGAVMGIRK